MGLGLQSNQGATSVGSSVHHSLPLEASEFCMYELPLLKPLQLYNSHTKNVYLVLSIVLEGLHVDINMFVTVKQVTMHYF